ncbi:Spo0B C-terminal domain-containing protein [Siminovitchia sediminis]|uniref:Spo0B C-terminal domain-containing protein n=1 Tax=Siminovitchia sediminis TaxID=1274353 RepID=A0ABW4KFP7_9BACI
MSKHWTVLETLKYTRHDWLNRLQLIKGNLSMGKPEQAERIMEEIVIDMQQEAMLSNIKLPRFAETLLTHNWKGYHFKLDYELVTIPEKLTLDDNLLTEWIIIFFDLMNQAVVPYYENILTVKIEATDETARFLFEFNGILENETELKHWLSEQDSYPDQVTYEKTGHHEWLIQALWYLNG